MSTLKGEQQSKQVYRSFQKYTAEDEEWPCVGAYVKIKPVTLSVKCGDWVMSIYSLSSQNSESQPRNKKRTTQEYTLNDGSFQRILEDEMMVDR